MFIADAPRRLTDEGSQDRTRIVERDTVIFVVRGMSLVKEFRVGIADRRLAFGQDCKALVARDGMDPVFLGFTLLDRRETIQDMVELAGHGTGKLSTDRLKAVEFALLPQMGLPPTRPPAACSAARSSPSDSPRR